MERDQEVVKLVNVLKKTARLAQQAEWADSDQDAAEYTVGQYNRVLARLTELDEGTSVIFEPLPDDASLTVVALACRQLAAYFEDEVRSNKSWGRVYGAAFDKDAFKQFWRQSARDIEDLGEYIRENVEAWARHRATGASDEDDDDPETETKEDA